MISRSAELLLFLLFCSVIACSSQVATGTIGGKCRGLSWFEAFFCVCFFFFPPPLNHWKVREVPGLHGKEDACIWSGWDGQVGGTNPWARLAQLCLGFRMWVGEDGHDSSWAVKQLSERDGSALLLLLHRWVLPELCCGLAQLVAEEEWNASCRAAGGIS